GGALISTVTPERGVSPASRIVPSMLPVVCAGAGRLGSHRTRNPSVTGIFARRCGMTFFLSAIPIPNGESAAKLPCRKLRPIAANDLGGEVREQARHGAPTRRAKRPEGGNSASQREQRVTWCRDAISGKAGGAQAS